MYNYCLYMGIRHQNEKDIYRWISWHFLPWELEGIMSPCCLLIGQYPHHMTLCPPVEKMLWNPSIIMFLLLFLITCTTIAPDVAVTAYQEQLRRWSGLNTQPLEMMTTYGSVPLPGLPCSPPPHLLHSCRL